MTITPPPPTDLSGLVEAFAQTTGAVLDLAGGLDESRAGLATECPGWTVLDQVRHVASIEALILGEPVPDHDVSGHAHVRNDFGVIIEKYLEGRRARSLQDVVDELTEVRERRLADLGAPDQTLESPSASPFGPATHGDVLPMRVFDIWCHEQDLREALGVPGGLDTAAAALSVSRGLMGLPRKIAQAGLLADGRRVVIEVTGPVATTFTVSDQRGRQGDREGLGGCRRRDCRSGGPRHQGLHAADRRPVAGRSTGCRDQRGRLVGRSGARGDGRHALTSPWRPCRTRPRPR